MAPLAVDAARRFGLGVQPLEVDAGAAIGANAVAAVVEAPARGFDLVQLVHVARKIGLFQLAAAGAQPFFVAAELDHQGLAALLEGAAQLITLPGFHAAQAKAGRRVAFDQGQRGVGTADYSNFMKAPGVDVLLEVDREYREKAAAGLLHRIAPRRQNPAGEAWLPILHVRRDGWKFTALFSNTPRAHDLHRAHDWVVILYEDGQGVVDGQATVVTEWRGSLTGRRVVRGREPECARRYRAAPVPVQMELEALRVS